MDNTRLAQVVEHAPTFEPAPLRLVISNPRNLALPPERREPGRRDEVGALVLGLLLAFPTLGGALAVVFTLWPHWGLVVLVSVAIAAGSFGFGAGLCELAAASGHRHGHRTATRGLTR
jgi:hypothetical protein